MAEQKKVFVIGGTGAQGIPVVQGLAQDGKYAVRVLTRDPSSRRAKELAAIGPNVEIVAGSFMSEADLRAGFARCWGAFVNIDGFATGEAMEMYWTIRCYELAIEAGIKFYVHGNIDFGLKNMGYDPKFRDGHCDGKRRMGEWIQMSNAANKGKPWYDMKIALLTVGPYIEMSLSPRTPMQPHVERDEAGDEVLTWRLPLGKDGAAPHASLDDLEFYTRWLFDDPDRADGMDLKTGIDHINYADMAAAFTKVTGRKARYIPVTLVEFFQEPYWASVAEKPCGYLVDPDSPAKMTMRENFTGWWTQYQHSGGNKGPCQRDYAFLDEIFPGRIRTAEEFFRREDEKARKRGKGSLWDSVVNDPTLVLKIHEDYAPLK
ncbi:NmrA-like family protein [Coniochaeta ligniaria NRRL 30616]|uniref:NmrA-like family protein n=1 Tax=Coniochaeta ligniaria NRRL 30616 TaxID=1408157 RepID=A0A1J7IED3_9PEZI|nr:NmrA-like family protein [Coniochaeta ligniaria NRRL 30616]